MNKKTIANHFTLLGAMLNAAKEILGHETVRMTMRDAHLTSLVFSGGLHAQGRRVCYEHRSGSCR